MIKWFQKPEKEPALEEKIQRDFLAVRSDLKRLRGANEHDFPKLNEATRKVQQLAASLAQLPDSEQKRHLTKDLALLRKELNRTTEGVMAGFGSLPPDPGLFSGLNVGSQPPVQTLVPASEIFDGSFRAREREREATVKKTTRKKKSSAKAKQPGETLGEPETRTNLNASPLPEDLFSDIGQVDPTQQPAEDPFRTPDLLTAEPLSTTTLRQEGLDASAQGPFATAKTEVTRGGVVGLRQEQQEGVRRGSQAEDGLPYDQKISLLISNENVAQQNKRDLVHQLRESQGKVKSLQSEETVAAEKEDFEKAAMLSARIEEVQHVQAGLETAIEETERDLKDLVVRRWRLVEEKIRQLNQSSQQHRLASRDSSSRTEKLSKEAGELESQAEALQSRSQQQELEQEQNLQQRRHSVQQERERLDVALHQAAAGLFSQQEAENQIAEKLRSEIEQLRLKLQEKEAQLEQVNSKLSGLASQLQESTSSFDDQRAQLALHTAELEQEEAACATAKSSRAAELAELEQRACTSKQSASNNQEEAAHASAQAEQVESEASNLQSQLDAERKRVEENDRNRARLVAANAGTQAAANALEDARREVEAAASNWAHVRDSIRSLEGQLAAAQSRLLEIEAEKKRAAASKDFKTAAALSAEAKEISAKSEMQAAEVERLRKQRDTIQDREARLLEKVSQKEVALAEQEQIVAGQSLALLQAEIDNLDTQLAEVSRAGTHMQAEAIRLGIADIENEIHSLKHSTKPSFTDSLAATDQLATAVPSGPKRQESGQELLEGTTVPEKDKTVRIEEVSTDSAHHDASPKRGAVLEADVSSQDALSNLAATTLKGELDDATRPHASKAETSANTWKDGPGDTVLAAELPSVDPSDAMMDTTADTSTVVAADSPLEVNQKGSAADDAQALDKASQQHKANADIFAGLTFG